VRTWFLGADGRHAEALRMKIWDISQKPFIRNENDRGVIEPEIMWPQMDGKVVFRHAVEKMIVSLMQAFSDQNITTNDVDLFLFHQANLRINQYVAEQIGLPPEKLLNNIQRYGNTTAATIPLLLNEAEREGRLKRGMKIAMVAFGAGFTWGSAIVDW
jgi:3-oxoacyl-[acyl-carrier-protein] synthase-3